MAIGKPTRIADLASNNPTGRGGRAYFHTLDATATTTEERSHRNDSERAARSV
jgi:hypothetical protein